MSDNRAAEFTLSNTDQNSENNETDAFKHIVVLGDCTRDIFKFEDLGPDLKDQKTIQVNHGGARFARNTLSKALNNFPMRDGRGNTNRFGIHSNVHTYHGTSSTNPPTKDQIAATTTWTMASFDDGQTFRVNPRPRPLQPIDINCDFGKKRNGYNEAISKEILEGATQCVIEDILSDTNDILLTKQFEKLRVNSQNFSYLEATTGGEKQLTIIITQLARRSIVDDRRNDFTPRLFIMVSRSLPTKDKFWTALKEAADEAGPEGWARLRERTMCFAYSDTLRWNGVHMSRQISWERTAQDYLRQWHTNPDLAPLTQVGHFVVRFGLSGAIYTYKVGQRNVHRLFFDPQAKAAGVFRDAGRDGELIGNQTIFLTRTMLELAKIHYGARPDGRYDQQSVSENISRGVRRSITACQMHYDIGIPLHGLRGARKDEVKKIRSQIRRRLSLVRSNRFFDKEFDTDADGRPRQPHANGNDPRVHPSMGVRLESYPIGDVRIPEGCPSWSLLEYAGAFRLHEVAHDIVKFGWENTINLSDSENKKRERKFALTVPLIELGYPNDPQPLPVVDRKEVESYRSVRNMINKAYQASQVAGDASIGCPLCISVFGPPGTGKTFVVKKIVESSIASKDFPFDKINLSETDDVRDLHAKIAEFEKRSQDREWPVLFVDEFDSERASVPLGWLRYFLQPMESTTNGLIVFAGATSFSYKAFTREGDNFSDSERARFRLVKGPDFVSRLRGHIDVLGPNPVDPYDEPSVIRRALLLRSMLTRALARVDPQFDKKESLQHCVGDELIDAMLRISRFKHGARSVQAIIDMCARVGGEREGRFVSSTLPTFEQLNMHVDAGEFLQLIHRRLADGPKHQSFE